ncbi:MAG TPA: hypothetical protein VI455_15225, partial [Terriglobia bacterium]
VSSQVEATGVDDVLIDSIVADGNRVKGLWIWAAADNLRLAARNAVEIAEKITGQGRSRGSERAGDVRLAARRGRVHCRG